MDHSFFDITSDQRYFYMVILKTDEKAEKKFTKSFDDWVFVKENKITHSNVIHLLYKTDKSYHIGEQEIYYTKNNKHSYLTKSAIQKKYLYDCLIIHNPVRGFICVLAPFFDLLEKFRFSFVQQYDINPEYLCINIYSLIKKINNDELATEDLTIKATAIGISKNSSGDISNIIIKGNKPLTTEIGERVFEFLSQKDNDNKVQWTAGSCRIKSITGRQGSISRINISLNTDKYGNFKMYLQKACLNIFSLLSFIDYVLIEHYFKLTPISPTSRNIELE